jgi:isoamylase
MSVRVMREGLKTVVQLTGQLGAGLPAEVEAELVGEIRPGCHLELDVSGLDEMTPGGLRTLLLFYRRIVNVGGRATLVGASRETYDVLDAIGFLHLGNNHNGPRTALPKTGPQRIDVYPTHRHGSFALGQGFPLPFGALFLPGSQCVNFSVFSGNAERCTLVLFNKGAREPLAEIPFPDEFRVGQVFTMIVFGLDPDRIEYGFRMDGPHAPGLGHRFDTSKILLDPYARAIGGREVWGRLPDPRNPAPLRSRLVYDDFDWEDDRHPRIPTEDLLIYEMHARGFTRHPSSGVRQPGTFAAIREKIPYLKELGVNCIELMPIFEFDEFDNVHRHPETGQPLMNYWGYSTVGFFAPKAGYAATGRLGMQADELKALVKELHRNGIEVILDVVFNHTAEGNEHGPTFSFRGLDNKTYYMLTPDGRYLNFSGCGNTLNCNHPVVRDMVVSCLRYWVSQYHIDGFRFDLASILGRDVNGVPLSNPPLLEALAHDPILAHCKLIAEAWDAAGLYQVGNFPSYGRWAEWNGRFRDCARRFLKGDAGQVHEMAQRLVGSPDLYADRGPSASVNFVTCHDGFTLWDLVSYNDKQNEANGESNRDGHNDNASWNCGVEGPTDDPAVHALRLRQAKNAVAMLMLSQGVPMLLMGDEFGRTQRGNNNAYCHDSELTWLDWSFKERNPELFRFCKEMIAFRRRHSALRYPLHPGDRGAGRYLEVTWHGPLAWQPDWSFESRTLAFMLRGANGMADPEDVLYVALNMHWQTQSFGIPSPPAGKRWFVAINTGVEAPEDIWAPGEEPAVSDPRYILVRDRAVVVLVARPIDPGAQLPIPSPPGRRSSSVPLDPPARDPQALTRPSNN